MAILYSVVFVRKQVQDNPVRLQSICRTRHASGCSSDVLAIVKF